MKEFDRTLTEAHSWLKLTQIKENVDLKYYRQRNLVGFYCWTLCALHY